MPANVTPPGVSEYLDAFEGGVVAKNNLADNRGGSRYDIWAGVAALLFSRASSRARTGFRNIYFDAARNDALDDLCAQRYSDIASRVLATKGEGAARVVRATAGAGAGIIEDGTRIAVVKQGSNAEIRYFEVVGSIDVGATDVDLTVSIRAYVAGKGQAASAKTADGDTLSFEDAVFDATLKPISLTCEDGTNRALDSEYQANVRSARRDGRVGYPTSIIKAMRAAGAEEVRLFASDYFGEALDHGLNRVYVADASFNTSAVLLAACRRVAFDCVTCGMAPQVLPLQSSALKVTITLTLWDAIDSGSRDGLIRDAKRRASDAVAKDPFLWKLDALGSAARGDSNLISDVSVTSTTAEPSAATLFDSGPLTRWTLSEDDCSVVLTQLT